MDVIGNYIDINGTQTLDTLEYAHDSVAVICTILGLISDSILIYIIARNVHMRTKTNLIIMHIAINDLCFLCTNMHFISCLFELLNIKHHLTIFANCVFPMIEVAFQLNEVLFVICLISNTIMKNEKFCLKWVATIIYAYVALTYIVYQVLCHQHRSEYTFMQAMCAALFITVFFVELIKELNSYYKSWCRRKPLSKDSNIRFNVGRLFIASWFFAFFCYMLYEYHGRNFTWVMVPFCLMTSLYILTYMVYADEEFRKAVLNICQREYDKDAIESVTFVNDDSKNEGSN